MNEDEKNRIAALAFSLSGCVSGLRFQIITKVFSSASAAFASSEEELLRCGLREEAVRKLAAFRRRFNPDEALRAMEKEGILFCCCFEDDYPALLKEISDPPIVLYYKGKISPWPEHCLAVVGSRRPSLYGQRAVEEIIPPLSRRGLAIISGLAFGIDSLAHFSACRNGGKTFAILGSGIDRKSLYPAANRLLAENIIKSGGAVISEFPPGTPAAQFSFPQRNRIISGLSRMVLVIEAGARSGAAITARYALEQGRDVGAVPGSVFSCLSAGTNKLISEGAKMITEAGGILESFGLSATSGGGVSAKGEITGDGDGEKTIIEAIKSITDKGEAATCDEISRLTQLDSPLINSTLSILEIAGTIIKCGSGYIFS